MKINWHHAVSHFLSGDIPGMGVVAAVCKAGLFIILSIFISLALPMIQFEAQKCSVRNVFQDEDEYLEIWQRKHWEPVWLLPVPAPWTDAEKPFADHGGSSFPSDELGLFWPETDGVSYLHYVLLGCTFDPLRAGLDRHMYWCRLIVSVWHKEH